MPQKPTSTHSWKRSGLHFTMDLDVTPLERAINPGLKVFTFWPHYPFLLLLHCNNVGSTPLVLLFKCFSFCLAGMPVQIFLFFINFWLLRIKNVTGCAMLSLLELTQSRKCKILQCDEYQIVKIPILINPAHSIRTKL